MQIEVGPHDALKLHQTVLGVAPKALNTVDVIPAIRPLHKLIRPVIHTIVAAITPVNQPVIRGKAVRVYDASLFSCRSITDINVFLDTSGTIRVYTRPPRFNSPNTIVLPKAPRPRLPRTRRAPKYDSSSSTSP